MNKIGIVGKEGYARDSKVSKLLFLLRNKLGEKNITINTGGVVNDSDTVENLTKKLSLELGLKYREYNPSFTGYKLYSAMLESYYGKKYHVSHFADRYKNLVLNSDIIYFFGETISTKSDRNFLIKYCDRYNKRYILIK